MKKPISFLILTTFVALFITLISWEEGVFSNSSQQELFSANCNCPLVHDPVCGIDGVTYSNACFALCNGVNKYTPGACDGKGGAVLLSSNEQTASPANCNCPLVHDPVCGIDGVTYSNACFALCNGVNKYTLGACDGKGGAVLLSLNE